MNSKFGMFSVLVLGIMVLLIPSSSIVNAQEYNKKYYYENNDDLYFLYDERDDYVDKNYEQYYYEDIENKIEFIDKVKECEDCFFSELSKLDRKIANKILYLIDKKFGNLTELCKLIASEKIDRKELDKILDKILNSPEFVDKKKIKKFFKDFETRSSTNYDLDEFKLKDKRIDAKSLKEFKENVLDCLFPLPDVVITWAESLPGDNRETFAAMSSDSGATFGTPVNVSDTDTDSISPQVAMSDEDVVITWAESLPGDNIETFAAMSSDSGSTFETPVNVSDTTTFSVIPQIAMSDEDVVITWEERLSGINFETFAAMSSDSGATFGTPVNVSDTTTFSSDPQVAMSDEDVVITWAESLPGGNTETFAAMSNDSGSTFGTPVNVSDTDTSSPRPQIAMSGEDVVITWTEILGINTETFAAMSNDSGSTFGTPVNVSDTDTRSDFPQIAMSGEDVVITWTEILGINTETFAAMSSDSGSTFGTPVNVSDTDTRSFDPQIAMSGENVVITWTERLPGNNGEIFAAMSSDSGSTFGTPVNVSDTTTFSFNQQIAMSGENVVITWTEELPGNNEEIFAAMSSDSGSTFGTPVNVSDTDTRSVIPQIVMN